MTSRRTFLRQSSGLAGSVLLGRSGAFSAVTHAMATPANTLNVSTLATFVDPLPLPSIAQPIGTRALPAAPKIKLPYYRFAARPVEMKIHRDLKPTRFWSLWAIRSGSDSGSAKRRGHSCGMGERTAGAAFSSHRSSPSWGWAGPATVADSSALARGAGASRQRWLSRRLDRTRKVGTLSLSQ